jgi:predicted MFS family arabinose efflux permease
MLPHSEAPADVSLPELLKTSDVTPSTPASLGKTRKCALVIVFCLAQFMDAFNISSIIPAIPAIAHDLSMKPNETTWLFAAYGATFAAFLLIVSKVCRRLEKTYLPIFYAERPDQ